jgi:co-chaperonin GroES (HSP10)
MAAPGRKLPVMLGEDDTVDRVHRAPRGSAQVEPLDDYLVIEPSDETHETAHGLIIPAATENPARSGVVVSVGDDAHGISPGDKVVFARGACLELRIAGEPILLVRRRDLIARYAE